MTLPRLDAVIEHWNKVPPISHSAAAIATFLGVGKPQSKATAPKQAKAAPVKGEGQNAQALLDLLGGNGFATEKPAWLTETTAKT